MREIKFRGQRLDNREWVYGSLIQPRLPHGSLYEIKTFDTADEEELSNEETHEVYFPTIGEFFGLRDIKSVDLYTGDIFEDQHNSQRYEVKWSDGDCGFVAENVNRDEVPVDVVLYDWTDGSDGYNPKGVIITGNIHETKT